MLIKRDCKVGCMSPNFCFKIDLKLVLERSAWVLRNESRENDESFLKQRH